MTFSVKKVKWICKLIQLKFSDSIRRLGMFKMWESFQELPSNGVVGSNHLADFSLVDEFSLAMDTLATSKLEDLPYQPLTV